MKKIGLILSFALIVLLAGCATNNDSNDTTTTNDTTIIEDGPAVELTNDSTFALSTYLGSNLLSLTSETTNNMSNTLSDYNFQLLSSNRNNPDEESENRAWTTFTDDLDEINVYFDKLKVFMDQGVDSTLQITESSSTKEGYEHQISYSIDEVNYTIYYSVEVTNEVETTTDSEETLDTTENFDITGLIIINEVEYDLVGNNVVNEDGTNVLWFKTIDKEDSDNYIKVSVISEEGQQKFHIHSEIDGVRENTQIKLIEEENATKIQLKIKSDTVDKFYFFKKEVSNEGTMYKLNYKIDKDNGVIMIKEITDEEGNVTYQYKLSGKQNKEMERTKPKNKYEHREQNSEEI